MALVVQKFGGTSVASIEHIERVAKRIAGYRDRGDEVVVVVSAMGKETDRLDELAKSVGDSDADFRREVDVLLSTGEQVTAAVLSMVLTKMGYPAKSFTGGQVKILTDASHTQARILDLDTDNLRRELSQ
ncbi:MAG: aspartate kinase, partial [Pseudomonadales bacterium]